MEVVKPKRSKKRRVAFIVGIIIIVLFLIYAVLTIIGKNIKIAEKKHELEAINTELSAQLQRNDELKGEIETGVSTTDTFIERAARENLGYAKPGEQIFVNISGN